MKLQPIKGDSRRKHEKKTCITFSSQGAIFDDGEVSDATDMMSWMIEADDEPGEEEDLILLTDPEIEEIDVTEVDEDELPILIIQDKEECEKQNAVENKGDIENKEIDIPNAITWDGIIMRLQKCVNFRELETSRECSHL